MVEQFFNLLDVADDVTWSYLSVPAVVIIGIYLSFKSGWIQLFKFKRVSTLFLSFLEKKNLKSFAVLEDYVLSLHQLVAALALVML